MTYFVKGIKHTSDGDEVDVVQINEKTLLRAKGVACAALIMQEYDSVDLYDSSAVRIFGVKRC